VRAHALLKSFAETLKCAEALLRRLSVKGFHFLGRALAKGRASDAGSILWLYPTPPGKLQQVFCISISGWHLLGYAFWWPVGGHQ
jgi:hypothetical protein